MIQIALISAFHKASNSHRAYTARHFCYKRGFWCYSIEIHITANFTGFGISIDTHINNDSSGLNHIGSNYMRFTYCRHDNICLSTYLL